MKEFGLNRVLCWCAALVLLNGASLAVAADSPLEKLVEFFIGGDEEVAAVVEMAVPDVAVAVGPNAGAQFRPLVHKAAARELYFVKKVCRPDDETYERMKTAAAKAAQELCREYAQAEQEGKSTEDWPGARAYLSAALLITADETLLGEVAEAYRRELEARQAAFHDAGQRMMTRAVDRRVTLVPDQYEPLREAVAKNWDEDRHHSLMIFMYDQYLQLPPNKVLAPVLDERQEKILKKGNNYGRIHFGWEQELGLQGWNENGLELEGLEDLSQVDVDKEGAEDVPIKSDPNEAGVNKADAIPTEEAGS